MFIDIHIYTYTCVDMPNMCKIKMFPKRTSQI